MIRGQRFELELDLGDNDAQDASQPTSVQGAFVGDILERKPATAKPPSAPTRKSKSGFPEHRKRSVESRFKQQSAANRPQSAPKRRSVEDDELQTNFHDSAASSDGKPRSWEEQEKQRIDQENRQRLAEMSPEEIEEERRELMESLSPAFLERLLRRTNIESGSTESDLSSVPQHHEYLTASKKAKPPTTKTVTFAEPEGELEPELNDDQAAPLASDPLPEDDSLHFPRAPQPPDLDPSSPHFLEDLHSKYFPSLPSEPDKLAWMQETPSNTYSPDNSFLQAKDLRFDFTGTLLPPRTAASIPVTAGLHHHADAPDAAGYTIAELARLAQSSYAAQRCLAFQTLGRVLYRLGTGEFGDEGDQGQIVGEDGEAEEGFGELARGLWWEVERAKVLEVLVRESEGVGGHVSARAYATEALWLWRKGGGRRWKAE